MLHAEFLSRCIRNCSDYADGISKVMFSGDGREGVSQPASQPASKPASQQANYTKHTPRETLNRRGTFSMAFCGLRSVWMVFFVGACDLRDGDYAQNLGAQIDQK